jgi:hypothetical protein
MAWQVEYGFNPDDSKWYWRLINRTDYDRAWIACIGGGGWVDIQDCLNEIKTAKQFLPIAPEVRVHPF